MNHNANIMVAIPASRWISLKDNSIPFDPLN